jgi:alkylation response protein AidB-like acyl-CoA dehydrogenase
MTTQSALTPPASVRTDWIAWVNELGSRFAARAAAHDATDTFVRDNYADLRAAKVFSAGVPADLGGGDASHAELCAMLRALAGYCSSTALALSMHTHLVASLVWRRRWERAPVEPLLRRIAAEELILVSSGGSDWLPGSGTAERVEGGYRVTARKIFSSGSPSGQVLMTGAVLADPTEGPLVLHFGVPLDAPGVSILDNWRTLGMRATGSNDVVLDGVFIPETAVSARRPAGKWHALYHVVCGVALPLIYAVYVGVAEAARDIAVREAARKREDASVQTLVGEMENELATARLALGAMMDVATRPRLDHETTNVGLIARTLAGRHAIRTVEKAMEVVGGSAFFRSLGLERLFRDVQGARYHALREQPQLRYTGRLALGLDPDG